MNVVAIIPARGGSKRLPKKNIVPILGKPLLGWAIEAALASPLVGPGNVFVSTEDDDVAQVALQFGAQVIARPAELADDQTWTEPVIQHGIQYLEEQGRQIELVLWMNACAAEVTSQDIDHAINRLVNEGLREVFSVDANLCSTSVVRALRRETLFQRRLSVGCAVMILDYVDIHYLSDIEKVESRLRARETNVNPSTEPDDGTRRS